jgi:hypothetical protein
MKSVVDLFIVKDRTAIFWFTMACVSIVGCALFVQRMIAAVQKKPQYVIMDASGTYYLAPSVEFEKARDLHVKQTQLAMETLYTRDADNLRFGARLKKLFSGDAINQIQTEFLAPDAKPFTEQKIVQTIEVEEADIYKNQIDSRGIAITRGKGKLTRRGTFKGQEKTEVLEVEAFFWWRINGRMADNGAFPTYCYRIKAADPKKAAE